MYDHRSALRFGPLVFAACAPNLEVDDLGPAGLLGRRLAAAGDEPPWVVCESPDEPREQLFAAAPAGDHLEVYGLLPDTAYTCTLRAGRARGEVNFTTDPLPEHIPLSTSGTTDGYTLVNAQASVGSTEEHHTFVVVVDPDGGVRWIYDGGYPFVCDIDAQYFGRPGQSPAEAMFHVGGGWASMSYAAPNRGMFRDVNLAGEVVFERTVPDFGLGFNHHSERLADGTTLSLTSSYDANELYDWIGVGVELWSPDDGVVWGWSSQTLLDAGILPPNLDSRRPYEANAVALVEDPWGPAAWVSSYTQQQLWRIDRATGQRTHLIPEEFTVVDPDGNALPTAEFPYDQHDPEWSDGPYGPDTRVLMYDNGNGRPGGSFSRVVEYDVDLDTNRLIRLWDWTEPGWWNPTLGDADRLENGHVRITQGFNPARSTIDVSEIVELDPPDDVRWRLTWGDGTWSIFRSEYIDACALFANGRYCRDVRQRIDDLQ
jgi:hypothetical protein